MQGIFYIARFDQIEKKLELFCNSVEKKKERSIVGTKLTLG